MEEKKMRELNMEEMDKVSGGGYLEAWEYRRKLREKYGPDVRLNDVMTPEEREMEMKWLNYMPYDPKPE